MSHDDDAGRRTPEPPPALSRLRLDREPPPELLERVVGDLRSRGLITGRAPRARTDRPPTAAWLVAIATMFAAGLWIGRSTAGTLAPTAADQPRFMLLLYEGDGFRQGTAEDARQRVREYGTWARSLARQGRLVAGDELAGHGREIAASGLPSVVEPLALDGQPRGYFVIVAPDEAGALAIAATCPHLRYGGRVVLRPIVK